MPFLKFNSRNSDSTDTTDSDSESSAEEPKKKPQQPPPPPSPSSSQTVLLPVPRHDWAEFDISSLLNPLKSVKFDLDLRWPSAQLSRYVFRASMWFRSPAAIERLPTEILVEIFMYMGWKDVLCSRQSCKRLFEISTARPLWLSLFHRLCRELKFPPFLEGPMDVYTVKELERVVLRRVSAEICWNSQSPNAYLIPRRGPQGVRTSNLSTHIVDGGRWLLTISHKPEARRVLAYDLDNPFPQDPRCIIELEHTNPEPYWLMSTDVDPTQTVLTFNLSLIPDSTSFRRMSDDTLPRPEIHIYRVRTKGHGSQATLEAQRIKSLHSNGGEFSVVHAFHGHHFARNLDGHSVSALEICNWHLSGPSIHTKSFIFYAGRDPIFMAFLPNNKFVAIFKQHIDLYDITNLHSVPVGKIEREWSLEPYWTHSDTELGPLAISKAHYEQNESRIAIGTQKGIFGLTVPSEKENTPSYERITNLELLPTRYQSCLGIDKIYSHNGKGVVRVASYTWPDDRNVSKKDALLPTPATGWREWKFKQHWGLLPRLDERSNRVFTWTGHNWVLMDFASS